MGSLLGDDAMSRATIDLANKRILLPQHRALLEASAISQSVWEARGYFSAGDKDQLAQLGFADYQQRTPALVLPIWSVNGEIVSYQIRPDSPRLVDGKSLKYETPAGSRPYLDVHPDIRKALGDPSIPLHWTEGARKADAAISKGLTCISLQGVFGWRGTNSQGGTTVLPDFESIALKQRTHYLDWDSDAASNEQVRSALERFAEYLSSRDAKVFITYIPQLNGTSKTGMDDFFAAGHSAKDLLSVAFPVKNGSIESTATAANATTKFQPPPLYEIYTADTLEGAVIPERPSVVKGIVLVGLTMLGSKSKLGKSWLVLGVSIAIAKGEKVLGADVQQGDVLYLALEDQKKRMQTRIGRLLTTPGFPARLSIVHHWPKLDAGGLEKIEGWLKEHPEAKLVVIDVWKRIRSKRTKGASPYDEDYEHLIPLQSLAQTYAVAILVVHHTTKAAAEDVLDELQGTMGVSGALDTAIVLHRSRGQADAEMWITGRDLEDQHLALTFDAGRWTLLGTAAQVAGSKESAEVIEAIKALQPSGGAVMGPVMPKQVADALGQPTSRIRVRMFRMAQRGELRHGSNGTYELL